MTLQDQLYFNNAGLTGDVFIMRRASHAVSAIASVLHDEDTSTYCREGLLEALEIIANDLDERAAFISHEVLMRGGDDDV
ncbi:hypothetical protein ELY33_15550 [Vreelandella andesensis]|uniref:Uncharacterized protein n=1 Tax=Vreelandella andesensis TaxID=447567 RepID=A0A3S1DIG6_9GAMM|nr:hypothetical protein [Halomonas andesensis]RUR27314.1 hypothetical protein ELY33_15550 [Halomonas andesensis]